MPRLSVDKGALTTTAAKKSRKTGIESGSATEFEREFPRLSVLETKLRVTAPAIVPAIPNSSIAHSPSTLSGPR